MMRIDEYLLIFPSSKAPLLPLLTAIGKISSYFLELVTSAEITMQINYNITGIFIFSCIISVIILRADFMIFCLFSSTANKQMVAPDPATSLPGSCMCPQTTCQDWQHHLGSQSLCALLQTGSHTWMDPSEARAPTWNCCPFGRQAQTISSPDLCSASIRLCLGLIPLGKS